MTILPRLKCFSLLAQKGNLGIKQLKQIHTQIITNGINSLEATAKLIGGYCAASAPDQARLVFNNNVENSVFLQNVMIRCIASRDGIRLFADGIARGELVYDKFTYLYVLGACARSSSSLEALWGGKQVHCRIVKTGYMFDVVLQTTGIHFYASCGDCLSARKVFDEMPVRNSATWNAMISGYCSHGKILNEHAHKALLLFREMLLADSPTDTTMVCVLSACSCVGDLAIGSCVHGYIQKAFQVAEEDVFLGTGLVDMYSKCGCLGSANEVFNRMKVKNVLTWTAMMAGLALHGQGKEALEMLNAMERNNIRPNAVTFISLLFACCHSGLVDNGVHVFNTMASKFNVTPKVQHYGCMVDLLGRAGRLEEAYDFIVAMPFEPDIVLWRCLLGACGIHGDVAMGEKVGKHLIQLQLKHEQGLTKFRCEDFVALSNVYAFGERWDEVQALRDTMRCERIQIKSGSSSVQVV